MLLNACNKQASTRDSEFNFCETSPGLGGSWVVCAGSDYHKTMQDIHREMERKTAAQDLIIFPLRFPIVIFAQMLSTGRQKATHTDNTNTLQKNLTHDS